MQLTIDYQLDTLEPWFVFFVEFNTMVNRMLIKVNVNMDAMRVDTSTWGDQFRNAMNVNGGDIENATTTDYVMHFLTFGWKVCGILSSYAFSFSMEVRGGPVVSVHGCQF